MWVVGACMRVGYGTRSPSASAAVLAREPNLSFDRSSGEGRKARPLVGGKREAEETCLA
jgi:hypothetical protein